MRIVETTPDRLTLESRPWVLGTFLALIILFMLLLSLVTFALTPWLGAGMLTFGLVVFDLTQSRAVFSRREGTVTITHGVLGRGKPQVIKLGAIRECFAEISGTNAQVTGTMLDGGQKRPALAMRQGKSVPLSAISNVNKSQELAVQAVNDWLGRTPKGS